MADDSPPSLRPTRAPYDVAGHFPDSQRGQGAELLGERAGDCRLVYEADPEFPPAWLAMNEGLGPNQPRGIAGNLLQWNSLRGCAEIKGAMEADHGVYDWVVWLRPDVYFFSPIESLAELPRSGIYFPIHDGYWGLNDRCCFGESAAMERRMRILDYFVGHWYPRRSDCPHLRRRPDGSSFWNPEIVLRSLIDDRAIALHRTRAVFGLLRRLNLTETDEGPGDYFVSQPQVWEADLAQPREFQTVCRKILTIPAVRVESERVPLLPLDACQQVFR